MKALVGLLLFVGYPLLWLFILRLLSRFGGWAALAKEFRIERSAFPWSWPIRSASFGWVNYGGCLQISADQRGLFLRPMWILSFAHPPLLIPWERMEEMRRCRSLWQQQIEFTIKLESSVKIRTSADYFHARQFDQRSDVTA